VMRTREEIEIPPDGEQQTAYDGDFRRSFGKTYAVDFKNRTGQTILTVSGESNSFSLLNLDPALDDRATNIKIKPYKKGFRIGLVKNKNPDEKSGYKADMYKVPKGIKLIEIVSTGKEDVYTVIPTEANGQKSNPLQKDKTKIFYEAKKTFWRDVMIKAGMTFGAAAAAGAAGGATGALLGGLGAASLGAETSFGGGEAPDVTDAARSLPPTVREGQIVQLDCVPMDC